jgi:uncharacterized protein
MAGRRAAGFTPTGGVKPAKGVSSAPTMPASLIDAPHLAFLVLAGALAGAQNVLAGGGSFLTFPALLLAGLNPLSANMTSTIAMFPGQVTAAVVGRDLVAGVGRLRFRDLFGISLVGGALGALLLQNTPVSIFVRLVPWLVLFATAVFAWGSFRPTPLPAAGAPDRPTPMWVLALTQGLIAVYGGYFGGGIGFLMLAALTFWGQPVRNAGATKNALAMAMNASAMAIFAFSPLAHWPAALALGTGGILGGLGGSWLLHRLPAKILRGFIVIVGVALTVWLFVR